MLDHFKPGWLARGNGGEDVEPGVFAFVHLLGQWQARGENVPNIEDVRVDDGTPCVVYRVESDDEPEPAISSVAGLLGGCVGAFKQNDYHPDHVDIVALPANTDEYPTALRGYLTSNWARECVEGRMDYEGIATRVQATFEAIEAAEVAPTT